MNSIASDLNCSTNPTTAQDSSQYSDIRLCKGFECLSWLHIYNIALFRAEALPDVHSSVLFAV